MKQLLTATIIVIATVLTTNATAYVHGPGTKVNYPQSKLVYDRIGNKLVLNEEESYIQYPNTRHVTEPNGTKVYIVKPTKQAKADTGKKCEYINTNKGIKLDTKISSPECPKF